MLREVTVPKRVVTETLATKHCYWNTWIPVAAIWVWCSRFRSVVGTRASPCTSSNEHLDPLTGGRASDAVVVQIQRYMGYVLEEIAEDHQWVRGVIIALDDDKRIRRALQKSGHRLLSVRGQVLAYSSVMMSTDPGPLLTACLNSCPMPQGKTPR